MRRILVTLFSLPLFFTQCKSPPAKLANSYDPDIVLINVEQVDREFIGKLLLKLDSLNPLVIGIDVTFQGQKKPEQDSALIKALRKIKNDILVYSVNPGGLVNGSDSVYSRLATDQGNLYYEQRMGMITTIIPLQNINDDIHQSFAFKLIKYWKPDFNSQLKVNEKIDISYTRNLDRFNIISGSLLLNNNVDDFELNNKVALVGFVGPGSEDKHFTPLRHIDEKHYGNEPDTYGLVIIANEIRTILDYKK